MRTDREWMYQKYTERGILNMEWVNGIMQFVELAFNNAGVVQMREGTPSICCSCRNCDNLYSVNQETVTAHLLEAGFCNNYTTWYHHGEPHSHLADSPATNHLVMEEMVFVAAGQGFNWEEPDEQQAPCKEAMKFFDMMAAANIPLWELECNGETKLKCENHSVLSAVTKCLELKAHHQLSQRCFDEMMGIIKSMLPGKTELPENFYRARKLVSGLNLAYERYDVCKNFCMLYYGDRLHKDRCDVCHESRYKPQGPNKKGKRVAWKVLRYLPIGPRLQRLYLIKEMAKHMRYHKEGVRENEDVMAHPADAEDWQQFDQKHPDFTSEVRNVRLGLSTDGFMPFQSSTAPYSCWPVFLFPYNLPPGMLMKEDTMFLTLLLSGPDHPGRDIDICLEPLIDELKKLWTTGLETYDVHTKQNFNMKAMLLWTKGLNSG